MAKIANFTPDAVTWTHVGISGTIEAGKTLDCEEGRANFILSKLGPRGLVKLEFSEDPQYLPRLKAQSARQYKEFWERQLYNFNQMNEARKNEGKPYDAPDERLTDKAREFSITLIGPWKTQNTENDVALKTALETIQRQAAEMAEVKSMVLALAKAQTEVAELPHATATIQVNWEDIRNSFRFKSKADLKTYLEENKDLIPTWPKEILDEFVRKYKKTCGEEPEFKPADEPKAETAPEAGNEA